MSPKAKSPGTLRRSLAVFAIAATTASLGCAGPHLGRLNGATLTHVLGFDSGCNCGDACNGCELTVADCANCPPDGCVASGGGCCEAEGCGPAQGPGCSNLPACNAIQRVAEIPCDAVADAASCCTPHACPGPPDVPPPGRFHPVPTRPVFAPRFEPVPFGQAEF